MKKLSLLLLLVPYTLFAPEYDYPFDGYHVQDILLDAIIKVESGGNAAAINSSENAVGILQIRPIMIAEANRLVGYEKYSLQDRTSPDISKEIWYMVQSLRNPEYDFESACNLWNAGHVQSDLCEGYIDRVNSVIAKKLLHNVTITTVTTSSDQDSQSHCEL